MMFDVLLPMVLFLVTAATLYIHSKYEMRVIPDRAVMIFFISAYSLLLFLFTYLVAPKWYLAFLPPVLFTAIYFSPYWTFNVFGVYWIFNVFGIVFAILVAVLLGSLFEWKTTAVFVILITIMDIIQVLVTGHMVESGTRMVVELRLPVMIILPTFPSMGGLSALGLGDIFLPGLLSIQTAQKYGRKLGFTSAMAIAAVFLIFQTVLINSKVPAFPATVFIISGWLITLVAQYLYQSRRLKHG